MHPPSPLNPKPKGLARHGKFLFVVDDKMKCVHTIDLLVKSYATVHPSMSNNEEKKKTFENLSGLTIVGQYLILMDFGPSDKPNPCLHVFDLNSPGFPRVDTLPLKNVLMNFNAKSFRLSLKDNKEQSFFITGNNGELVTCRLQLIGKIEIQ